REDAQLDGEDLDQDDAHQELGNRLAQNGQHAADVVDDAVLTNGGDDADADADDGGQHQGITGQLQGVGHADRQGAGDGGTVGDGITEVTVQHVAQPVEILNDQRIVQAQLLTQLLHHLGAGGKLFGTEHEVDGIDTGRLQAEEHDQADDEQHRDHQKKL